MDGEGTFTAEVDYVGGRLETFSVGAVSYYYYYFFKLFYFRYQKINVSFIKISNALSVCFIIVFYDVYDPDHYKIYSS